MKVGQWVGVVLGTWLMASPAVLGYVDAGAGDVHRTIGPLLITFSLVALWPVTRAVRWANLPLAVALGTAPLLIDHSVEAALVSTSGALVLAAATPLGGDATARYGPGWRGLVQRKQGAEP